MTTTLKILTRWFGPVILGLLVMVSPVLGFESGDGSLPPPATGAFAYNSFVPPLVPAASYIDPVFGETVRRLTVDHSHDDIYARNMWWSADETRYLHRVCCVADYWNVIQVATGAITHTGLPNGDFAADGGFDPVDANVLYYIVRDRGDGRGEIHRLTLGPSGSWTNTVEWTAPSPLGTASDYLGGTINWLDASGRYMLVRYGPEPSVYLLDRQNLAAGPYGNAIDARNYVDEGSYLGLTPDGGFVVGFDSRFNIAFGLGEGVSWAIDHAARTVAPAPNVFWSLCGDHGAFASASDGRNYMIVSDCDNFSGLWRVDITNNADGLGEEQKTLPNNRLLIAWATVNEVGGHVSTVARGLLRDWVFYASEDGTDEFNGGVDDGTGAITPWHAYRQEIMAINMLTGEIRRLAHHRSRSLLSGDYYAFPRLSASWGGGVVGFASNFNQPGVTDIYAIQFAAPAPPPPPSVTIAFTTPTDGATVKNTVAVSAAATGSGIATVVFRLDGGPLGPTFTTAPYAFGWDTRPVANGGHTLAVLALDGGGQTLASASIGVVVSNPTPAVEISRPKAGATVKGDVRVAAALSQRKLVASVQFQLDGLNLGSPVTGGDFSTSWRTTDSANGPHTLRAIATTTAGATVMSAPISVTVANPAPSVTITQPKPGASVKGEITVAARVAHVSDFVSLQFQLDGVNLRPALTSPTGRVRWNTLTTPNGMHTLVAIVTRQGGATVVSDAVPVVVNNPAPTVRISKPAAGATVKGSVDVRAAITNDKAVASLQVHLDGHPLGPMLTDGSTTVKWDTTAVADGPHSLRASVTTLTGVVIVSEPVGVTVANTPVGKKK